MDEQWPVAIPLRIFAVNMAKKRMKHQIIRYIKILDENALGVTMRMACPSISLIPCKIHYWNFMESWNPGRKISNIFSYPQTCFSSIIVTYNVLSDSHWKSLAERHKKEAVAVFKWHPGCHRIRGHNASLEAKHTSWDPYPQSNPLTLIALLGLNMFSKLSSRLFEVVLKFWGWWNVRVLV